MDSPMLVTTLCATGVVAAISYTYYKRPAKKYFPGPPAEPILGHLRKFPQDSAWVTFNEWSKEYGGQADLLS